MGDIRPEFVFLGFLAEGPAHGYQIYRCFRENLERLWHISESQMYATLKRLEKRGWIIADNALGIMSSPPRSRLGDQSGEVQGRLKRQRFALSAEGLKAYEAWLNTPTLASPRLLKLEFITRLYFALRRDTELAYTLIEAQRLSLEAELVRIKANPFVLPGVQEKQVRVPGHARDQGSAGVPDLPAAIRLEPSETSIEHVKKQALLFDISILANTFRIRQIEAALEWLTSLL